MNSTKRNIVISVVLILCVLLLILLIWFVFTISNSSSTKSMVSQPNEQEYSNEIVSKPIKEIIVQDSMGVVNDTPVQKVVSESAKIVEKEECAPPVLHANPGGAVVASINRDTGCVTDITGGARANNLNG